MTFLDIIEIYNISKGNELDNIGSLFEDIDIDERLDKDVLVGVLLDECGAMRCIYETTATFKYFSDNFFKKWKWSIGKMLDTLELEYDPTKNMDLTWTETTKINQDLETAEERDENRERTNTGTQKNEYEDNTENTISAMNSGEYQPDNKSENSGDNTRTDNLTENVTIGKDMSKNENLTWDEEDKHIESGHKDVAVQDLIEKERKIADFSVYGWISRKYAKEMFLLVY